MIKINENAIWSVQDCQFNLGYDVLNEYTMNYLAQDLTLEQAQIMVDMLNSIRVYCKSVDSSGKGSTKKNYEMFKSILKRAENI